AIAPDGATFAVGNWKGQIQLFEVPTCKLVRQWTAPGGLLMAVAFAPDGKLLASGRLEGPIRLWEPSTGQERQRPEGHLGTVEQVGLSADETVVVTISHDRTACGWDLATGKQRWKIASLPFPQHARALSPDGRLLAACRGTNDIVFYDTLTGKEL